LHDKDHDRLSMRRKRRSLPETHADRNNGFYHTNSGPQTS
jgi:hypothetical protein